MSIIIMKRGIGIRYIRIIINGRITGVHVFPKTFRHVCLTSANSVCMLQMNTGQRIQGDRHDRELAGYGRARVCVYKSIL